MKLYGLKTCDTCRKALKTLQAAGQDVQLIDIRAAPLADAQRSDFLAAFGPDLINRRSTTWRGLDDAERAQPPEVLLAAHPALMKRPVIEADDGVRLLGWTPATRAALGL